MDIIRNCVCQTDFEKEHAIRNEALDFLEALAKRGDLSLYGKPVDWSEIIQTARTCQKITATHPNKGE